MLDKATSNNPLEQFVLLAKSAKGTECLELIRQVLEAPGVFVFGELLDMPNILELKDGPNAIYYDTLHLFAYGTYREYLQQQSNFLELSPAAKKKLQHLTIVSLAADCKCIPYEVLLRELDVANVRILEDLIIEAIYADIIHGKLDQRNSQLELDSFLGRDIGGSGAAVVATLQRWSDACAAVLACVDKQIAAADQRKAEVRAHRERIDLEVQNIKKTLKSSTDGDEPMTETRDSPDKGKKAKGKAQRGESVINI